MSLTERERMSYRLQQWLE